MNATRAFGEPRTNLIILSHPVIRKRCLPTRPPSSFRATRINRARVANEHERKKKEAEVRRVGDEINTDKMILEIIREGNRSED